MKLQIFDEFIDKSDDSKIYITGISVDDNEISFTRHKKATNEFLYEIIDRQQFDWFIELGVLVPKEIDPSDCGHTWKHYSGITNIYDYCIYCDTKRPHNRWLCDSKEGYYGD